MNNNIKHRIWFKTMAIAVVCLFSLNSISWALPQKTAFPRIDTLQVQSIFKPILDVTGREYETQIRVELAHILATSLKNNNKPWHDINGELDEWISAAILQSREKTHFSRLLKVVKDPVEVSDGTEIIVELTDGPQKGKKFRIISLCKNIADIQQDAGKLKIQEIPSPDDTEKDTPENIAINGFTKIEDLGIDAPIALIVKMAENARALYARRKAYQNAGKKGKFRQLLFPLREHLEKGFAATMKLNKTMDPSRSVWKNDGEEARGIDTRGDITAVAFCNEIRIVDTSSGAIKKVIRKPYFKNIHTVTFHPERDDRVLISNAGFDNILEMDINTEQITWDWDARTCGYPKNPFGLTMIAKGDPIPRGKHVRVLSDEEARQAIEQEKPIPPGEEWVVILGLNGVKSPFGLEKYQKTAEPNWSSYGNGPDEIIATLFISGQAIKIDRKTKKATVLHKGLSKPHGIIPFKNGYIISDTKHGQVLYFDKNFKLEKIYDFRQLQIPPDMKKEANEWIQFTAAIGDGTLLATVDGRRSKLYVWDPDRMIYSEYPIDKDQVVQSVLPFPKDIHKDGSKTRIDPAPRNKAVDDGETNVQDEATPSEFAIKVANKLAVAPGTRILSLGSGFFRDEMFFARRG